MAIDFDKALEEQLAEETGPALDRPLHFDDEEIEDEDAFEEGGFTGDLANEDDAVEEVQE